MFIPVVLHPYKSGCKGSIFLHVPIALPGSTDLLISRFDMEEACDMVWPQQSYFLLHNLGLNREVWGEGRHFRLVWVMALKGFSPMRLLQAQVTELGQG